MAMALIAADAPPRIVLREQLWMRAPHSAEALLEEPAECLAVRDAQIEAGRALFRSPFVLGGPSARVGLSCQACHTNGARNARFFLPELTDREGAADVTSSWSSAVRGDGVMNPRDIPSLVGAADRSAFGADGEPSLERFVRAVVVEEFQGRDDAAAIAALVAYVRAQRFEACPDNPAKRTTRVTLISAADDVRRAVAALSFAPTRAAVALAARDAIGRIVERLPGDAFAQERRDLADLARGLAMPEDESDQARNERLIAWRARFDGVMARAAQREDETYFNADTLSRALQSQ